MTDALEAVREAARKPFLSLHMDGRNEHGTHLLSLPKDGMGDADIIQSIMEEDLDPKEDLAEEIFKEAEKLGHKTAHAIVTLWTFSNYDEGGGYFEYDGISKELTSLFWGTPEEQDEEFDRALKKEG